MSLGRKQRIDNSAWLEAVATIEDAVSRAELDELTAATVADIKATTAGKRAAYAWSAGKDSIVLGKLCEVAGVTDSMIGVCDLEYRTLADNLSTTKNYVLDMRPAVLGLAANERVTEIMFVFGTVPAGFAQVETPTLYGTVHGSLSNGTSLVNSADVGGLYSGQWVQAVSRWLTTVYAKMTMTLPKTGY